jgi:ABC-type transport system substrate-binding protein
MIDVVFGLRAGSPDAAAFAERFAACTKRTKKLGMESPTKAPVCEYDMENPLTLHLVFNDFDYDSFIELCAGSWDEWFVLCSAIEEKRIPELSRYMVLFNMRRPELSTPATRRALALLLDRRQIEAEVFGTGIGQDGLRARYPGIPNVFDLASATPGRDVAAAKRLLSSDGWSEKNGAFQRDGRPLAITVNFRPGNPNGRTSRAIAARVAHAWRNAGITAVAQSEQTQYPDALVAEFPLSPGFSWPVSSFANMDTIEYSSYDRSLGKLCSYGSARLNEKTRQLGMTFDEKDRRKLLNDMNGIFIDDCPAAFLFIQKPSFYLDDVDTRHHYLFSWVGNQ